MTWLSKKLAGHMLGKYALQVELFQALKDERDKESPSFLRTVILSYAAYKFGHEVTVLPAPKALPGD
jgi:hypothetical protein